MTATPRARRYTLILVGDHSRSIRKLHLAEGRVRQGALVLAGVALVGILLGGHYVSLLGKRLEHRALRDENARLRSQIHAVEERVAHISATLDRVEQFDAKLRGTVKQLQGTPRGLAIGPVGKSDEGPRASTGAAPGGAAGTPPAATGPTGAAPRGTSEPSAAVLPDGAELPTRLASLEQAAVRQESSLRSMQEYFDTHRTMLATTPSTWPARGWVTSDFGERLDPYTAERVMHRGLDIATSPGNPVLAPSDATVSFAGTENGYGKVLVLDHGNGLNTRYAHLSSIQVRPGQRVKRGMRVGAVGNTGRSTGPHLHYEVRVNGIAENPRKFILE